MERKRIVIIPTFNERQNIERLITEVLGLPGGFAILVVDDNSPDGTASAVEKIAEKDSRVSILQRASKQGLGSAYRAGLAWSVERGFDLMFAMDADFSHQPKHLRDLDALLATNDLAVGSRYVKGGGIVGWPLRRRLLSAAGNLYARAVIGSDLRDNTGGFIGMRKEVAETILRENTKTEGYVFHIELKHIAQREGYQIKETPITFIDRVAGKSKISRTIILEAFIEVWKFRFRRAADGSGRGNRLFKLIDRYIGIPLLWSIGRFVGRGGELPRSCRSILVIKLSALGDTVLLVPALRGMRKRYPDAKITALGTGINKEIFEACPYVDETITLNVNGFLRNPFLLLRLFKARAFDVALDFDQWLRLSPILALASGAKCRAGFMTGGQGRHYVYTHTVEHSRDRHEIESFLDIVKLLGVDTSAGDLEFRVNTISKEKALKILADSGMRQGEPFIVIHPETPQHGGQRQWPLERYADLSKAMGEKYGMKIVISGTKSEEKTNKKLAVDIFPHGVLLPPMSVTDLAAVYARSSLLVCGNTGVMHLACALGIPVVALHGPTDPAKWGPRGNRCRVVRSTLPCSPCLYLGFEYGCPENRCMQAITVPQVLEAIAYLLKK